jgi:acyl dehydratase
MTVAYFEDFHVGQVIELGSRAVGEAEIVAFAREYDPQYFHTDPAAAGRSIWGGLVASGWHTASMYMRLLVDGHLKQVESIASPGVDEIRWLKPVRPGDTLHVEMKVVEVRPSQSKPDRGIMRASYRYINQAGEAVLTFTSMHLLRRRPKG